MFAAKPNQVPLDFINYAERLADEASMIVRRYYRQRLPFDAKPDYSPVTAADQESEAAMRRMLERDFPQHGIVGEEYGPHNINAEYVWVIDPIDGTKAFVSGKPLFGTLVALLHHGLPIIGIINQPILRERWVGARGRPTAMNGVRVSTRKLARLKDAVMTTTSPDMFKSDAEKQCFGRLRDSVKIINYGGDCYSYGLLAMGFIDVIVESGLHIHDFAALMPIIEGAGGVLTDWSGHDLSQKIGQKILHPGSDVRAQVVAAGDANVHREAIALLR